MQKKSALEEIQEEAEEAQDGDEEPPEEKIDEALDKLDGVEQSPGQKYSASFAQRGGQLAKGLQTAVEIAAPTPVTKLSALGKLGKLLKRGGKKGDEAVEEASGSANRSPDFVVSANGTAIPVPEGAQGPVAVTNSAGKQTGIAFTGGRGGENGQVDTVRIMNPTPPRGNSPGYPSGYVKYENSRGQGVDPSTGRTIQNSESHFPIE